MWIPTSQEAGFLLPLVAVNAVCDLEGCYSSQGIQDFLCGPARESQIMNSLQKKVKNVTALLKFPLNSKNEKGVTVALL